MPECEHDFGRLYTEYQPRIRRYLARRVGEHDAEDLTQTVFLKVSQALKGFRGESTLSTWIYRIATIAAADWMRGPSSRRATQCVPLDDPCNGDLADQVSEEHSGQPLADQALIRREMNGCNRPNGRRAAGTLPSGDRTE